MINTAQVGIGFSQISKENNMTKEEFIKKVGSEPIQDDLERVNCDEAGTIGHQQCGWCSICDTPRFMCAHILKVKEKTNV